MARIRSPNYPAISLPEAIERIDAIHQKEQHLEAPRDVMARHLGYGGINGSSLKVLSALLKYGLLERTALDRRRVTDLALQVLHPREPGERSSAIRAAAFRPVLFAEISKEWPNGTPSDANLRAYLLRRNFAQDAIPEVIDAYRKTMELVTAESGSYTATSEPEGKKPQMVGQPAPQQRREPTPLSNNPPVSEANEMRVTFTGAGRLEVNAVLIDAKAVDRLIRALKANRAMLEMEDVPAAETESEEC
jgi:hypothetical protein